MMQTTMIRLNDLSATQQFANALAKFCQPPFIIFLAGDLGVGKTTLVRFFLRAKGYLAKVKSPSYTLIESYDLMDCKVVHADFYRIFDPDELAYLALEDILTTHSIVFIEWPDSAVSYGLNADMCIELDRIESEQRQLKLTLAQSKEGMDIDKLLQYYHAATLKY